MFGGKLNPVRLVLVSVTGALILEVILAFAAGLRQTFTVGEIPTDLAGFLVGALVGLLFELLRQIISTTEKTLATATEVQERLEALTAKIRYQDEALAILLRCPRHNEALSRLIKASISDNFRTIPLVGVPAYLDFLRSAIAHSESWEGIQRKSLSWFRDSGGGSYLNELKQRAMHYKIRLFIIDDADFPRWEADLKDKSCMDYYWNHTGNVTTYWMTTEDFLLNFPQWDLPPRDLALYDRQLIISYDEPNRILTFDVLDETSRVVKLFQSLEHLASQGLSALHEMVMPEGSVGGT